MKSAEKPNMPKVVDLPLAIGLALTVGFYVVVLQEPFHGTLLYRYTAEHLVEYLVVAFFLWGLADTAFHVTGFPGELLALRQPWMPRRIGREPASRSAAHLARLRQLPARWLRSRIGTRYVQALTYVDEQGSAGDLADHLRHLADADYEKTQGNYALLRFICWVMPMFGFLGTVVHFGTALAGQTSTSIAENLPKVVGEMGTAFNTTTAALATATTTMFAVFLCERIERGIVRAVDEQVERDLASRFETADPAMAPFLEALHASNQAILDTMKATVAHQLDLWSHALAAAGDQGRAQSELQAQAFDAAVSRFERGLTASDDERQRQFDQLLLALEKQSTVSQRAELLALQATLSDNLRLLRETGQLDQAVHGLTAAIHLLTARNQLPPARAA